MKKKIFLFISVLFISLLSYSDDSIVEVINSIDTEYQELLLKEEEKKTEFINEKMKLEEELANLKERTIAKEETFAKLKRDSEIRWHRDEYKKLLKKYDEYHRKLEAAIKEREMKIIELEKILSIIEG